MTAARPISRCHQSLNQVPAIGNRMRGTLRPAGAGRRDRTTGVMMYWFWLNVPLAAACFLAWCGIPLWMVLKHPSWGPEPADSHVMQ
jgi:hypothetical protein